MTLLVLAGTAEARALLARVADLDVIASLAGVTRRPMPLGVPTRIGGFGGAQGFTRFLAENRIRAVLDATHPFAGMAPRTAHLCAAHSIPMLRLTRPPWQAEAGDAWIEVPDLTRARAALPATGTVFLGTGAGSTPIFADVTGPTLWLRRVDAPDTPAPWRLGGYLIGLPSDDPQTEAAMLQKINATCLVAKNSGGAQGYAKIIAARDLKLPVIMVRRPDAPDTPRTEDIAHAATWLRSHA